MFKSFIQYHNNFYNLTGEDYLVDEEHDIYDWKFTNVDILSEEDELACKVITKGNLIRRIYYDKYYNYNNKIYKYNSFMESDVTEATQEDLADLQKVFITYGSQTIKFKPEENQTWYDWATDTNNTDDIDLSNLSSGLTLKGLIIQVNDTEDNIIKYNVLYPSGTYNLYGLVEDDYLDFMLTDSFHDTRSKIESSDFIETKNYEIVITDHEVGN